MSIAQKQNRRRHYRVDGEDTPLAISVRLGSAWRKTTLLDTGASGIGLLLDGQYPPPDEDDVLPVKLSADGWEKELNSIVRYAGPVAEPDAEKNPEPPIRLGLEFPDPSQLFDTLPASVAPAFNRRSVKRLSLEEKVSARLLKGAEAWDVTIANISIYGVGLDVASADGLNPGTVFKVELQLPAQKPVEIAGILRHVTAINESCRVGIQYALDDDVPPEDHPEFDNLNEPARLAAVQEAIALFTLQLQTRTE